MSKEMVTARNLVTGKVDKYPRHIAEHKIFGASLEIVSDGTKPKVPLGGKRIAVPQAPKQTKGEGDVTNG